MDKDYEEKQTHESLNEDLLSRRDFFVGLKKWSKIVIGGALVGTAMIYPATEAEAGWLNRRGGGGWVNGRGGGWLNRRGIGGWINAR